MFEGSLKINEGARYDKESNLEIVDIGEFLPANVKTDMNRLNNTRFMVKRFRGDDGSGETDEDESVELVLLG